MPHLTLPQPRQEQPSATGRSSNLLITKLRPPRAGSDEVVRARLLAAIDRGTRSKLTLVVAPAGYGKSILAAQWQRRANQASCWLTLDRDFDDPVVFFDYLMGAIHSIDPALCPETLALLGSTFPPATQQLVYSLLNEVATAASPMVLVLDDYHTITSPEVHSAMSQIIRGMPVTMSVVIISRVVPDLPTLQMSARGELVELGPAELGFTLEETREFLIERQELDVSNTELDTIARWCDGWPVALRLVAQLMRGRSRDQIQELLSTLPENVPAVGDFLWDEVLDAAPGERRGFLLQTSILQQFNAELATAVCEDERAAELLAALDRDSFFLARIDGPGNWVRYHHLFAEALRQRLRAERSPAEIRGLHERAAAWYEEQGLASEAAMHAIRAENWEQAARLLTGICGELYAQERIGSLRASLENLPEEPLVREPILAYWLAWAELRTGHPGAAIRPIQIATREGSQPEAAEFERSALQLAVLKSIYAWDPATGMAAAHRVLERLEPEEHAEHARVRIMLALLQETGGDLPGAAESLALARAVNGRSGIRGLQVLELNATGGLLLAMGKLKEPASLFRRILAIGDAWNDLPVQHAHQHLGNILLEWNQPDEARRHAFEAMELARRVDTPIQVPLIHALLARLAWIAEDWATAFDEIEKAIAASAAAGTMGPLRMFEKTQCRLWLATNQLSLAQGWLQHAGQEIPHSLRYEHLLPELTAIRVRIHEGRASEILPRLEQIRAVADRSGWRRELLSVQVLHAIASWELGMVESAQTSMEDALRLAEPEGFATTFTLEGPRVRPILQSVVDNHLPAHEYASVLLGRRVEDPLHTKLAAGAGPSVISARERDVMRLVAIGLSNREIGDALFISEETVKTHLRRIFEKLEVSSRTQAVAAARSRGLL